MLKVVDLIDQNLLLFMFTNKATLKDLEAK